MSIVDKNYTAIIPEVIGEPQERTTFKGGSINLPTSHPPQPIPAPERLNSETLKHVIENYLQYYASGQGHTARAKRYDLQHFLEYLAGGKENLDRVRVGDWTLQSTKDFIDDRLARGESPATVSRRLATIKHFGRTLAERVHGYINPAREVKGPTLQPSRPHGLDEESLDLLKQASIKYLEEKKHSFIAVRNTFLLEFLMATGLRADEVRLLLMSQISENLEWLKNVKTKGRKFRNVYLDSQIREELSAYIDMREAELKEKFPLLASSSATELGSFPVFVSTYGGDPSKPRIFGLSPKTLWRAISDFGKRARALSEKPMGNLHPHRLRHAFAHGLLDSTKDVRLVAQALGHSDVRTTMRYTERTEDQIAKAIEDKIATNTSS